MNLILLALIKEYCYWTKLVCVFLVNYSVVFLY